MLSIKFERGKFIARVSFKKRLALKKANWNFIGKRWQTSILKNAARLREHFDDSAKKLFKSVIVKEKPWTGSILIPKDKKLDAHQIRGVEFVMSRNHSYLAFEAGLGKTPLSVAVLNTLPFTAEADLLIVPPFLISNWIEEIQKWQTDKYLISVIRETRDHWKLVYRTDNFNRKHIFIVPDSLLKEFQIAESLKFRRWRTIIVDEGQRFLNETVRTHALFGEELGKGIVHKGTKVIILSGSPMRKGPIELWPVIHALANNLIDFRDRFQYGVRYCSGFKEKVYNGKEAWNFEGSSREEELRDKLFGRFIYHETLVGNIKSLRGKLKETATVLDGKVSSEIIDFEKLKLPKVDIEDLIGSKNIGDIARYRKLLARDKIPIAAEYAKHILDSGNESLLLFGIHQDLVLGLQYELKKYGTEVIYGEVPMKERVQIEKRFKSGKTRVIVANINTMVGLNFQRATRVLFAESSYDYTDNYQALSRAFRRGQKNIVQVQHLVLANTLDQHVVNKVIKKKKTINKLFTKGK